MAVAEMQAILPRLAQHGSIRISQEVVEDPSFALRIRTVCSGHSFLDSQMRGRHVRRWALVASAVNRSSGACAPTVFLQARDVVSGRAQAPELREHALGRRLVATATLVTRQVDAAETSKNHERELHGC